MCIKDIATVAVKRNSKWIIFDVMGVIFEVGDITNDLLVPFIQKRNDTISAEKINEMYLRASLGEISSFDFWKELGFRSEYPEIEREYLDAYLTIDPDFIETARTLVKNYYLAMLSNDVKEWSAYLRAKFDLNSLFKIIIISGEVGYRKPDKRIYNILLERIQSSPSNCVFIDDRAKNLLAASEMGIKTIRFIREDGYFPAGFEISSFAELPRVIERAFE
ncbi:Phosphoglycolate phosphatase [uncultured archaeon]|nr:Phosphoglycolate phosphatase [uncultured archaeon]